MVNNDQAESIDAASASLLSSLQKQRSSARGNITRIKKLLEDRASSLNPIDLECRLEILNSYIKQLMAYQTEIEKISTDDKRGELEEICISTKSLLLSRLGSGRRTSISHDTTMSAPLPPSNRLPHLKIPKFSGKYSEYKNFITCVNNLVHEDPTLTKIEKFNHLIASLQEDALRTVRAFQVNEQNYDSALARLAERYDNNCLIFQDHIASLFNLKKMSRPNASELREIIDTVSAVLDSLSHLGTEKDITHAIVIHLVLSKLDGDSKAKWDEQLNYTKLPQWSDCASVLIRRCQFLEINDDRSTKYDSNSNQARPNKFKSNGKDKRSPQFSFACAQTQSDECSFCSGRDHFIASCPMFATLKVTQRFEYTKRKSLCINCLKIGHSVKKCRASRCSVCQRPHHTMLHNQELIRQNEIRDMNVVTPGQWPTSNAATTSGSAQCFQMEAGNRNTAQRSNYQSGTNTSSATSMCVQESNQQVILATALVQIKDRCGKYQLARALLDSGSQVNLATEEIAHRLSLKRFDTSLSVVGVGDNNKKVRHRFSTYVKSRVNDFEFMTDFYVMKTITCPQPHDKIEMEKLDIPTNVKLADPQFNKPQRVDILVGAESFFELLSVGQIKLGPQLPTLQKTLLGWIVSGKCESRISPKTQLCNTVEKCEEQNLVGLNEMVQKFWELEQVPNCCKMTSEQLLCESHFAKTTSRIDGGRFEVRLPFKSDPVTLGNSYETAKRRFLSLERRMSTNPDLKILYIDFMREYLTLGHMSPYNIMPSLPHYFIPHQCVLRAHSTTTKLRVVFDASCKTTTQKSLNDTLMVGPTIQNDLFSTLARFRLNKYAITADITKMYRQVNVHKDDRKFQLILWRENSDMPIQIYELNTVTYGTGPAPFLAIRCLKEISDLFKNVYPIGSKVIAADFYVDDLLSGADDIETLAQIRREVIQILSSCGFCLAKWYSNVSDFNGEKHVRHLDVHDGHFTRALGIGWKPQDDILCFQLENDFGDLSATKRNILSVSSRLFDPLGLLAPIIIKAKILLQELWTNNLDWDESIPQNLDTIWSEFKTVLSQIDKIVIPRFVGTTLNASVQIHGFADASMKAYGCCIYVVSKSDEGTISRLFMAKSRVAPSKKVKTLPRLELCAAHLLAKLWSVTRMHFSAFRIEDVFFWSDSEIVLHWVKTHPSVLNTFVGNRVAQIEEYSAEAIWQYVPSAQNPADIVSRGCTVSELQDSIWLSGPEFLHLDADEWPKNSHFDMSPEDLVLEKKKSLTTLLNTELKVENLILKLVQKTSSYRKALRIVAYILRFIRCSRNKCRVRNVHLSVSDLNLAFCKIVETIQSIEFKDEIKNIENSDVKKRSHIQKLSPFLQRYSDDGLSFSLLRVGGRLSKAHLPYDEKFPLLISKASHFITLYFTHLHLSNCHAGPKALLGLSREKLWVINARQLARRIVHNCVICFRFKPSLNSQIMGDLPRDRLTGCRPFWICGVDLCGPVLTTLRLRGRPPVKTYVAVFVCFASKAVHLEALSDLQTDTFLCTLNRFVGRRGLPRKIWCDNATNFVGTARLWNARSQIRIQQTTAEKGIEFQFIPPRAPHFGGLWEAAVKSAKHLMLRTIGSAALTFEELTTVLVDVEAVLNSRPIVALTEDPNDEVALTPGHLLIGCSLKALPDVEESGNKAGSLKRFRILSSLKAHFWDAWRRDYVRELQNRVKWESPTNNIKFGDVVMIHEDNLPPQKWLIGKVVAVETSPDNKVRVAEIQTKDGTYRRPIHKLALLPFSSSQTEPQFCNGAGVEAVES